MELLIYLGVLVGVVAVIAGSIWVSKRFDVQKEDLQFAYLILGLVNYVTSKCEFNQKVAVVTVMEYVMEAVDIAVQVAEVDDIEEIKDIAIAEAKIICEKNGIDVDEEFVEMLEMAVDYLLQRR